MQRDDSLEKTDAGRYWGQEEKGTTEDETHGLNGRESIPGWGRSLGERKGYPLQYSSLENSMDLYGVTKSQT